MYEFQHGERGSQSWKRYDQAGKDATMSTAFISLISVIIFIVALLDRQAFPPLNYTDQLQFNIWSVTTWHRILVSESLFEHHILSFH